METTRDQQASPLAYAGPSPKRLLIPLRYHILFLLFFITTINNADRATLNVAGPELSKDLGLDPVQLGLVLSAFGWSYVVAQLPGGWLLDRLGSYRVYIWCIILWSLFTFLQGFVGLFSVSTAIVILFGLRFLLGLAEAPSFPANGRIVASWFPTKERGTAAAVFNSAQYFATVLFAPLWGSIIHYFGWRYVFWVMGALGLALVLPWLKIVRPAKNHPWMTPAELAYMEEGGALTSMDQRHDRRSVAKPFRWSSIQEILTSRMMLGIFLGQYCINTLTAFFLTWFFSYLVKERHMTILNAGFVAILPALCGFCGGILGGVFSDYLVHKGFSLTFARKLPIVTGMLLSCIIVTCNYVDTNGLVILFMSLAFFGKGIGALGWTVVSDTAPKQVMGICGGLFNMFGNISTISTPIAVGFIIKYTGSFNRALVFVGAHAIGASLSYLFVVGEIKRLELKPEFHGFPVTPSSKS